MRRGNASSGRGVDHDLPAVEGQVFDGNDYTEQPLPRAAYERCTFTNCTFPKSDLSAIAFRDCAFDGCDFSNARLVATSLNDVRFVRCKLMGVHFEQCNTLLMTVGFDECMMQFASFLRLPLKHTRFRNCYLQEVDFTDADLTRSVFERCDLERAIFDNTNLTMADLRSSFNYAINPERNKLKKAEFSLAGVVGLLGKYDIVVR